MGQVKSHISEYFSNQNKPETTENNIKNERKSEKITYKHRFTEQLHDSSKHSIFGIVATPRNPLKRSRQVSPKVSLPQSIIDIFSPSKRSRIEEEFLNYSFLDDSKTVNYYRKNKILIILRGLPGSGKSTISKHIERRYAHCSVCSADHFFMEGEEYVYNKDLIKEAHSQCQQNAIKAVQHEVPVVVIDNTNLKLWEMNFYLELATVFNYIPVIVEPKTPWRRDIPVLVSKNIHNINEEIIRFKSESFEDLLPLYYGWFLNEKDSYLILDEGRMWIEAAYQFKNFKTDFQKLTGASSVDELLEYYQFPDHGGILHCTSKFIGKNLSLENREYIDSAEKLLGKVFDIEIIGFVLTPRTFGARVKLSKQQLTVWDKDDDEEVPYEFWTVGNEQFQDESNLNITESTENNVELALSDVSELNGTNEVVSKSHINSSDNESFNIDLNVSKIGDSQKETFGDSCAVVNHNGTVDDDDTQNSDPVSNNICNKVISDLKSVEKSNSVAVNSRESNENREKHTQAKLNGISPRKVHKRSPKKVKGAVAIPENTLKISESRVEQTITIEPLDTVKLTYGKGSRAHFTLGCAPGVKPVTTGLDLIFAIQKETEESDDPDTSFHLPDITHETSGEKKGYSNKKGENTSPEESVTLNGNSDSKDWSSISLEGATARNYGNGVWVFYLEDRIIAKSVFSAKY